MLSPQAAPRRRLFVRPSWRTGWRILAILVVFAVALGLRLRAVGLLGTDFDEDDYLRAGQLYAQHLADGDWAGVVNERENYEHPPLTKLAYGAILLSEGPTAYARPVMALKGAKNGSELIAQKAHRLRVFSAIIGAVTATAVALVNPLAGLLVAVNSWHIKYTSQAMIEALPCLFATLTLLLLRHSRRSGGWAFWLAAVALGLTAAGKYLYAVAGVAAVIWLIWREYRLLADATAGEPAPLGPRLLRRLAPILAWSALALLVFYLFDPALWPNPIGRLRESLAFSTAYAGGAQVQATGYGWEQPLYWLFGSVPWHPGVFVVLLDGVFSVIGLIALRRTWQRDRLLALWFGTMLLFLFVWPTKWPQYILTVTVPIALLAAGRIGDWGAQIRQWWRTRRRGRPRPAQIE